MKQLNRIMILMFALAIFSGSVLFIGIPDIAFSEAENRFMQQNPEMSWNSIKSGRFMKKYNDYVRDQFPFKDDLVRLKADIDELLLKKENKDIYIGKGGFLFEKYRKPGEQIDINIKRINEFIKENPELKASMMLIPNSIDIYEDMLPAFVEIYHQKNTIEYVKNEIEESINFLNIYENLIKNKDEYIYYKTDHHWTMKGAYIAYLEFCKSNDIIPYDYDDFEIKVVADDFYGTYYSKVNNRRVDEDKMEIFEPKFDIDYTVNYLDTEKISKSLFEYSHLGKRDKYSLFLDGNHALVKIDTSVNNDKKIAVIKDSYAHSIVPFIANHYEEVHMIDLRYFKSDVKQYLMDNEIDEVIFLYNVKNFSEDKSILI